VQYGRRERRDLRVPQSERAEHPPAKQGPERLAGDLLHHPAQDDEIRVRVVEALPWVADQRPGKGDAQQLLRGPLPEGVGVERFDERGVSCTQSG